MTRTTYEKDNARVASSKLSALLFDDTSRYQALLNVES